MIGKKGSQLKKASPSPRGRVLRWLEDAIAAGEIRRGESVPSERAVAKLLGVAQNTAAAALDEAETRGILVRRCPTARKRFVPDISQSAEISRESIYVLGEVYGYADANDDGLFPRWSTRFISAELLARLSVTGKLVTVLNAENTSNARVDALFRSPPAGMVITATVSATPVAMRALELCRRASVPVVVYGNAPELQGFDRVYSDHRAGTRALAEWLLAHGRRRIVPFFPYLRNRPWERGRLAGYADAMSAAGLKPAECVPFAFSEVNSLTLPERFKALKAMAVEWLLRMGCGRGRPGSGKSPNALVCLTDNFARVAIAAMRELGLEPHRDILVAGYDNIAPGAELGAFEAEAPDVTIDKHNERTAAEMAALLAQRLAGELPSGPQCRVHPFELIEPTSN